MSRVTQGFSAYGVFCMESCLLINPKLCIAASGSENVSIKRVLCVGSGLYFGLSAGLRSFPTAEAPDVMTRLFMQ